MKEYRLWWGDGIVQRIMASCIEEAIAKARKGEPAGYSEGGIVHNWPPFIFETENLDTDIREYFNADPGSRYVPTLPVLMQIERHLRKLLEESSHAAIMQKLEEIRSCVIDVESAITPFPD